MTGLTTDLYELLMMQGYFFTGKKNKAIFDMFYRTCPFEGSYAIFTGLDDLIDNITSFSFSKEDISYLSKLNLFKDDFLSFLSTYSFKGDIFAFEEGTVAFPGETLIRVEAPLLDAQLMESVILNTINFQTLIATKASRMVFATRGKGRIMEFGLRRAQGPDGALSASRASFIGGSSSTSNTLAGKEFGIPVSGTMAHSWVMSHKNEVEAFRAFASLYPENSIFIIDTYDTLGSGIDAAIEVGLEQKHKGYNFGVRIDSGDLSYLSKKIRDRLDAASLTDAYICVSNDINENVIRSLITDSSPIDSWGIGTSLVTGGTQASLNGVYKLSAIEEDGVLKGRVKVSNSYEKTTNPGRKEVYRFFDKDDSPIADLIALSEEDVKEGEDHLFFHPYLTADFFKIKADSYDRIENLLKIKIQGGKRVDKKKDVKEIREYAQANLSRFDRSYRRLINPHSYKVSLSAKLKELKTRLVLEERG